MNTMSITIVSSDEQRFVVPRPVAEVSLLIQSMEVEGSPDGDNTVPMYEVDGVTLRKVLEFCELIQTVPMPEIQKPLRTSNFSDVVPECYNTFINVPHPELFELAKAANFMDIPPLLNLTCAKIASMIKDKTVPEIRKTFSLPEDETVDEEPDWCQ